MTMDGFYWHVDAICVCVRVCVCVCCSNRQDRADRKRWLASERAHIMNTRKALRADTYRIMLLHLKLM